MTATSTPRLPLAHRSFWPLALTLALLALLAPAPSHAMVYTIPPGPDLIANNGMCSLREALINANHNDQSGSLDCPPGQANVADTIVLLAGQTYSLTIDAADNDADTDAAGDLDVFNNPAALDLQILSSGAERATIVFEQIGDQQNRLLDLRAGAAMLIRSVTLTGGRTVGKGGGIFNAGTLTLENVEVAENNQWWGAGKGSGIYTGPGSTLTLKNSLVRDNSGLGTGGGIFNDGGAVTIEGSSIVDNNLNGRGGGIGSGGSADAKATVLIRDSVISGNQADSDGGAIWNGGGSAVTIEQDSLLEENEAERHGGAIANLAGGTVTITSATIRNNRAGSYAAVDIATPGNGGAAWNSGELFVTAAAVHHNRAGKGEGSSGGAFFNSGTLVLSTSAVYANQTPPEAAGDGGAIFSTKTLVVLNTTISGNTASGRGGALRISGGYTDIRHATITGNAAALAHGGLYLVGPTPKVDIKHSILAGNTGAGAPADCANGVATLTSQGYNLVGDACGGVFGAQSDDRVGVEPKLAALAENDGPTPTHALLPASPALNAIPAASCADADWPQLAGDQRGVTRPQDSKCEIGAYERKALEVVNPNPQPTLTNLAPNSVVAGSGDFVLLVSGTSFLQGSVVRWNGSDRLTTFVSAGELKAGITAADLAAAGVVQVTVFNPGPGGGSSNAVAFVVGAPDKQGQAIQFAPLADRSLVDGPLALSATASSGLPVSYEASGACSIAGSSATPAHAGTCTITARQAGDATFNPAPDVVRTFTITGEQLFLPLLSR